MSILKYRNFDVEIRQGAAGYSVHTQSDLAGEATCDFNMPFSEDKLEALLSKLGPVRQVRDINAESSTQSSFEAAKTLGSRLFDCVFSDKVSRALDRSITSAERNGERLRIRLKLTGVPKLASLPWEYLYDEQSSNFLALSYKTSIVRYLDIPQRVLPLAVKPPMRLLVMASSPTSYNPLNVEKEWASLAKAFSKMPAGLIELERLESATLSSLRERLSQGDQFHIFHYIGHGGYDLRTNKNVLVMEDENRHANLVDGERLGIVLHNHPSLRMVTLNSCDGAAADLHDVFTGVAQNLIRKELPAVIAMQFKITDDAAVTLAKAFYESLARGNPVDTAIAESRLAILAEDNNVEWGTPVLYLRSEDGQLFNVDPSALLPVEPKPEATSAPQPDSSRDLGKLPRLAPTGPMPADSPFYVERANEKEALEIVVEPGITLTIQSAGQTGASSLLRRLMDEAKQYGKEVVHLNFQQAFENKDLTSSEDFHRRFCVVMTNRLNKEDRVAEYWEQFGSLSIGDRCTIYLQSLLRSIGEKSLLLAMDEVDRLIEAEFRSSFFGMLRSWHSERANDELFQRLDIVLVTSLEPHQLIDDPNQSLFSVGEVIKLNDFTDKEAEVLNSIYGSPLNANQMNQLISLIGGRPSLWQLALHQISKSIVSFDQLLKDSKKDTGPFGRHLSSWYDFLQQNEELLECVKAVLSGRKYEWKAFLKLRKMGLVWREGVVVQIRCKLYEEYFREHFNV